MSECQSTVDTSQNLGLAFGLVTGAGLASGIGGLAVFVMPYKNDKVNRWLAASLAVAAGVMIYVSFAEIFTAKAVEAFQSCMDEGIGYLCATVSFFGGVFICWGFDLLLHRVDHYLLEKAKKELRSEKELDLEDVEKEGEKVSEVGADLEDGMANEAEETAKGMESEDVPHPTSEVKPEVVDTKGVQDATLNGTKMDLDLNDGVMHEGNLVAALYESHNGTDEEKKALNRKLARMGIFAALAISFHNFPEGLATFVATLDDPSVGISVAIAIAIHNIPEGICVAVPIYYATGSKWKAFIWATLSGVTELVGAFLGWAILAKVFTQIVYGILFGIVGGMMVKASSCLVNFIPSNPKRRKEAPFMN